MAPGGYICMCLREMTQRSDFMSDWGMKVSGLSAVTMAQDWMRLFTEKTCTTGNCRELLFTEDVSHAADLRANPAEFLFKMFVATIEVIDAVKNRLTVGHQSCENE